MRCRANKSAVAGPYRRRATPGGAPGKALRRRPHAAAKVRL